MLVPSLLIPVAVSASNDFNIIDADGSLSITPIETEQALNDARLFLDNNFIDYRVEDASYRQSLGFIVVTETYRDKLAAAGDLQRLSEAGVSDYLFVARGDYVNRISAGVFGTRAAAEAHAAKLNRYDFSFKVIERFRTLGTRAIVIREKLTRDQLTRILTGELLDRTAPEAAEGSTEASPSVKEQKPIEGEIKEQEVVEQEPIEQDAGEIAPSEIEGMATSEPGPATSTPESFTPETGSTSAGNQADTGTGIGAAKPPTVVRTQPPRSDDGSWLWFLFGGILLIIAGTLVYYYLQRRNIEDEAEKARPAPTQPTEAVKHEPLTAEDVTPMRDVNVSANPEAFYEYAEAILEGRPGKSGSLTILGTEDTRVTELINDLLLLNRLEEKAESISSFAFDVRSLVDNLIDRLSLENPKGTAALKSSPDSELPATLLMDAEKLNRLLAILIQNAIDKTAAGVIDIHQFLDSGQLNTEIRYHPESKEAREELEAITNPGKAHPSVSTAERIRFSIANRMAAVMGGRIDTALDGDEALVQIRLPATIVPSPLTSLPAGKTIEDLVAAEEQAKAEAEQARTRVEETQAEINRARSEAEEGLRSSEQALSELREELKKAKDAQSSELEAALSEKDEAKSELESLDHKLKNLNGELETTRQRLESEVNARAKLEADAQQKVKDLENSLAREQTRIDQEGQTLRAREEAAKAQVIQLEEQLTSMQSAMDSESKKALQILREHLLEAEQKLNGETEKRTQAEEDSRKQVKDLMQQLNGARETAEQATHDKSSLQQQLEDTTQELVAAKTEMEAKISQLESDTQSAQARVDQLQNELTAATDAIEQEKQARALAEEQAQNKISTLEQKLSEAEIQRESALNENEAKVTEANSEIEALASRLATSEQQLEEQLEAAKQSHLNEEVEQLHKELESAREKLETEVNRRNSAEAAAGKQIEELLDELNLLRSDSNALAKARDSLETEKLDEISNIHRQLEEAQANLDAERNEKALLQTQSEENLNELEARLKDMEAEQNRLQAQTERAEAFGQHQTSLLEQALSDAENANKLGDAARKVTLHLKAKIRKLESQVENLEASQTETEPEPEPEPTPETETQEAATSVVEETAIIEAPSLSLMPEAELVQQTEQEAAEEILPGTDEDADFSLDDFDTSSPTVEPSLKNPSLSVEDIEEEQEQEPEEEPAPEVAPTEPQLSLVELETVESPEPVSAEITPEVAKADVIESTLEDDATKNDVIQAEDETPEDKKVDEEADEEDDEEEEEDLNYEIQFDDKPIRSSRPINNPVLHSMIERFVKQLFQHIDAMETALTERDYLELVVSCNWVRGEANTLGFEVLVKPIDSIEVQLRREKFSQIITHLSELRNMAERIEIKQSASPDAPIQYFVPAHAKNAVIYENFVSQLGSKLLELEVAASSDNTRQMTQLCKWINRYGTKIKFIEVVDAANQLQEVIESGDEEMIEAQLRRFVEIYAKIEIVLETEA